ncbi:hypothetical protein NA56DRAFT_570026, partial [Hyaloscypha hepaticicola]
IQYNIDIYWNYTLRIIKDTLFYRIILNNFITDYIEITDLALSKTNWTYLEIIYNLLFPFEEYIKFVSRE